MLNAGLINTWSRTPPSALVEPTARALCEVADELDRLDLLAPSPEVNALFARLVGTIVSTPNAVGTAVLSHPGIQARVELFRSISERGETELELEWAKRVCASASPAAELARFPYLENYQRLTRVEVGVLSAALTRPPSSLAFVGSGPLPLSAIFLARELDVAVDGFDRDAGAVDASTQLAERVGARTVRFHHADAADLDLAGYPVVVVAALVGATMTEKAEILARLGAAMAPGAILLARSTRGLRTLLYPPLDDTALTGLDVLGIVHPVNDIVNSVVIARTHGDG